MDPLLLLSLFLPIFLLAKPIAVHAGCLNPPGFENITGLHFGSYKPDQSSAGGSGGNPTCSYCDLSDIVRCNGTSITGLTLQGRGLAGTISKNISMLKDLTTLDLSNNSITGPIPPELASIEKLENVNLSNNTFEGQIPSEFGPLQYLRSLDFSFNRLSGQIQWDPFNAKYLMIFSIAGNSISSLPWNFGLHLENLQLLDLSSNKLAQVPRNLCHFLKLKKLVLRNNSLGPASDTNSNSIDSLAKCLSLNELYLSANKLAGNFPSYLGNLNDSLETLDISDNQFSGQIPSSIGGFKKLKNLYLQNNIFNGSLPDEFPTLSKSLKRLDLSNNNLIGQFPFEAFKNLEYLNLSFNDFEGKVPSVICESDKVYLRSNPRLNVENCNTKTPTVPINRDGDKNQTGSPAVEKSRSAFPRAALTVIVVIVVTLILSALLWLFHKRGYISTLNIGGSFKDSALIVTYADLKTATKGFSSSNLIGSGSTGSVYKGILLGYHDKAVAVKVLNQVTAPDSERLTEECHKLANIRHKNFANVLTSCEDIDANGNRFSACVYELVPRGNLEMWLHEEVVSQVLGFKKWNLSWYQRLNMAIDVAFALKHLHCKHQNPIVHCNLKPSNILIAEDMTALLVDFGMDRLFPLHTIIGKSRGYIAPECAIGNPSSPMWDVFSFGVILLEMFTGKRPTNEAFRDGLTLRKYVLQRFRLDLVEIIDPLLISEETGGRLTERALQCIRSIIQIALDCSSEKPEDRTEINQAHEKLQHVKLSFLEVGSDVLMPNGPFNRVESSVAMLV